MKIVGAGLLAGVVMAVIGAVFHVLVPWFFPRVRGEYADVALFRTWAGPMRLYMIIHPFMFGLLFAGAYARLACIDGVGNPFRGLRGGLFYGLGVFLVGSLPIFALNLASFRVSVLIIVTWVVQNFVQSAAAGVIVALWLAP